MVGLSPPLKSGERGDLAQGHARSKSPAIDCSSQLEDSLSTTAEQGRIAERVSLDYQRQAREQRGALALQSASLAHHFGLMQRAYLGGSR